MALTLNGKYQLEPCDRYGNTGTTNINLFDFHFLLKSTNGQTIDENIGAGADAFLESSVFSDSDDAYQNNTWYLAINSLNFSLGTGFPDNWVGVSQPPNTFFGYNPTDSQVQGYAIEDGHICFHTTKNANGASNSSSYNPVKMPYLYKHDDRTSDDNVPYSSLYPEWNHYLPILPSQCSEFEGTYEGGNLTSIKVHLGDLRNVMDSVFKEDGISFAAMHPDWKTNFLDSSAYLSITNDCIYTLSGGLGWGDIPSIDVNDENSVVPYEKIEGKSILFNFSVSFAKWNGVGQGITFGGMGNVNFTPSYDTILKPTSLPFNVITEAALLDPNWQVIPFPTVISFDPSNIIEGEMASGYFGMYVSGDFAGQVSVKVFDSNDVAEGNIPEEYTNLENFNEIDDVAQYGVVSWDEGGEGSSHSVDADGNALFEYAGGGLMLSSLTYTANDVGVEGQVDEFSVFVKLESVNQSEFPEFFAEAWVEYFDNLSDAERIFKVNIAQPINISDIPEEGVYYPSDVLVINPADVIFHLVEQELKYNKNINEDKIIEARSNHVPEEGSNQWSFAFSINKKINSKKLLQEISQSSKLIPTFSNDTFSYVNIKNTYTGEEEISTIKAEDVIKYDVSRTDLDKIYTEVEVQYEYDYGLDNHLSTTGKLKINTDFYQNAYGVTMNYGQFLNYIPADDEKNNYYGLDFDKETNILKHEDTSFLLESDYIRDENTAIKLAEHLLLFHSNQHNIINLTLPLKYYTLEVGDLIEFDTMILGRKLYGEKYVLDEVNSEGKFTDMPIRCGQYILPLFIVTGVTKTLKDVKVEVMQLHHLSKYDLLWKGEDYIATEIPAEEEPLQGDINGDGSLNILDAVLLINLILAPAYDAIADMNGDGSLNILDAVVMIQEILI